MLAWVVIYRRYLRHSTPISSSLRAQRLCVKLSDSFPPSFPFTSSISFTSFISHLPYTLPSPVSRNPFVCHSCEKCRVSLALSSLLPLFAQRAIHNSFPFKRLRTLSKNSRVYPNSSYFGTRFLTNQEIGFPPPHPIKSPRCPYPVRKWTGQSRNRYE